MRKASVGRLVGALAIIAALAAPALSFLPIRAFAQEEEPEQEPEAPKPVGPMEPERYAEALVQAARGFAEKGEWSKAYGYLKYVLDSLGETQWVKGHRAEVDEAFAQAEDNLAGKQLERAKKLAESPKRYDKADEALKKLRETYGHTRFVKEAAKEIEALEAMLRTALWTGRSLYRGEATLPRPGVLRLRYGLDRVEELADFRSLEKGPSPEVKDGCLVATRRSGVVRTAYTVPAGGSFSLELTAVGIGELTIVLEGEDPDLDKEALRLELDGNLKELDLALLRGRKGGEKARLERPRGFAKATAWRVSVRLDDAGLTATAHGEGSEARVASSERPAGPVRVGFYFGSGDVAIDEVALEGPAPSDAGGSAGPAGGAPQGLLPTGVWIPLDQGGLDGFEQKGDWAFEAGVLKSGAKGGHLVAKDFRGRSLGAYRFTVDVLVHSSGARATKRPFLSIALPFGGDSVTWTFTPREMTLEGTRKNYLETLPPDTWVTLTVQVDPKGLLAYSGTTPVLKASAREIEDRAERKRALEGLGFMGFASSPQVELRRPRIRLED